MSMSKPRQHLPEFWVNRMKRVEELDFRRVKLALFDFDGVFTDNNVTVSETGEEAVVCSRLDGLGLKLLTNVCVKFAIISTERNAVVSRRAEKLGCMCVQGVDDKAKVVAETAKSLNIDLSDIMFLGNDVNDIPAFKIVGFPIAVADAWPGILAYCVATTSLCGGKGAVREVCELIHSQRMGKDYVL